MKIAIVFLGVLVAVPTFAKTKVKVFKKPCSAVYEAAEKLASQDPYKIDLDAKTQMKLIVSGSFWKGRSQITVNFYEDSSAGTCTVTADSFYSGALRNGTVFLDRLEKSMK